MSVGSPDTSIIELPETEDELKKVIESLSAADDNNELDDVGQELLIAARTALSELFHAERETILEDQAFGD